MCKKNMPSALLVLMFATRVVLSGSILYWLHQMREAPCACAKSWKKDFLFWSLSGDLIFRLALLYAGHETIVRDKTGLMMSLRLSLAAFDVFQLAVLWSYARDLQKAACECSEGWQRKLALSWPVFYLGYAAGALALTWLIVSTVAKDGLKRPSGSKRK